MKIFTPLFLLLFCLFFYGSLQAQKPEQDCINANSVCSTVTAHPVSYSGSGTIGNEINPGSSCLASGETNDVWYIITVATSGNLNFSIKPYNYTNIFGVIFCDDYDWAVYNITNANCSDIYTNSALELSCNYSATQDITGTRPAGSLNSQGAGGNTWNKSIPVVAGQTLMLNISNFTSGSQSGYTLDFSGSTASMYDTVRPKILSIVPQCNSTVAVKFSENILCSTVQGSDFTITGPGGPYTAAITSSACLTGSKFENDFVLTVSPPFSQSGTYTVALTGNVTDNCGNISTLGSSSLNINNTLYLGRDTTLCQGQSITLNATTVGATSYTWSNGATSPTLSVSTSGTYSVIVNANGCVLKDTVKVTFSAPAVVGVTASPDKNNICQGTSVTFTAAPSNGGTAPTYQWYVNGNPVGTNSVTYTSSTLNNNDQVTVKLTSNAPCVSNNPATSAPVVMNISAPSVVGVSASPDKNNICQGTSITLTATPVNGGAAPTYQWYVNGNPVGTNSNTYTSSSFNNNDQVKVKLTSNANCISGNPATSAPVVINIVPPPAANAGADKTLTCAISNISIGIPAVAGNTYAWLPAAGLNDPTLAQPTASIPNSYTLTVTNTASGCKATDAVTVSQNSTPPVANAGADQTLTCSVLSVPIGTPTALGNSYSWSPAAGLSNAAIAQPNATAPNVYTLTVTNIANGCTATDAVTVSQNITPPAANAGADQTLTCNVLSVPVGTAAIAGNTYSWSPAAGVSNAAIAQPNATSPNTYTLTVTNTTNGCKATDAVTISQNSTPPVANAGPNQALTCTTTSVQIGTTAIAGNTYSWSPAAGLNNAAIAQPSTGTPNTYTLTVTNTANGCTATDAVTVSQNITPPAANAGTDKILTCTSTSVTLGSAAVAGHTYSWSPAAGLSDPSVAQPSTSTPNSYTLTVTNTVNGCTSTDAVSVTKNITPPVADAGTGQTLTCTTPSIQVGTAAIAGNTYSWSPASGLSNAFIAQPNATSPNTYTLTVTNTANGCTATDAVTITQNITQPVVNAGLDKVLTCTITSVSIGTPTAGGYTYSWSPAIGLSDATIAQPATSTANTYTLTVTNTANGCTATDAVTVSQNITPPVSNAGPDKILNCTATSVTIGSAAIAGNSYFWSPAFGLDDRFIAQPTSTVTGTYTVTVTNTGNGCTATDAVTISKDITPPVADAGADQTLTCTNPTVTLGSVAVGGNNYSWSPSAGLNDPALAQPVASTTGVYTLTVTKIVNGCTSTDAVTVSVDTTRPNSNAGADQILTCKTPAVSIGSGLVAGNTYSWSPSAGLSDPLVSQPSVATPGIYNVTVTKTLNGCTSNDAVNIGIDTIRFIADAGADQTITCVAKSFTIGSPPTAGNTYSWSPAIGLNNPLIANPTTSTPNTYTLTVTRLSNGCTSSDAVKLSIDTVRPVADAGGIQTLTCAVDSVILGTKAIPGHTYSWTPAATVSDPLIAKPTTKEPDAYTVVVTNSVNGCTNSSVAFIRQNISTSSAIAGDDMLLNCYTRSFVIGSPAQASNSYSWSPAAGLNDSTLGDPTVTAPGTYTLTVTNKANGCKTTDGITITQDTLPPTADAGIDRTLTCVVKGFIIGSPSVAGFTYSWSPSSGLNTTTIAQPTATDTGIYQVTVTRTSNGCTAANAMKIDIDTLAPVADAGEDRELPCPHTAIALGNFAVPNYTYHWMKNINLPTTDVAQPLTDSAGTYSLYVINTTNGCKSLMDTVIIYPKNCECTFFVPTGFTPNKDGVNDVLSAFRYCDDLRDFSFSIFNRWGEEVYHTTDMSSGWDGFYKSETTADSYVWVIQYFDVLNNQKRIEKGTVVLLK